MQLHKISVDVYDRDVIIIAGATAAQAATALKPYMKRKERRRTAAIMQRVRPGEAVTIKADCGGVLVYLPAFDHTPKAVGVLAHEMLHAAAFILRGAGVPLNEHTEEAYSYLLGYLTAEALRALKALI